MNTHVLYVYHCQTCNHRADVLLPDDSHEGDIMDCSVCSEPVSIEWDGGVTLTALRACNAA